MKIARPNHPPVGGWVYPDKYTETVVSGKDLVALQHAVFNHRRINEHPADMKEIEEDLNKYFCSRGLPCIEDGAIVPGQGEAARKSAKRQGLMKKGTGVLFDMVKSAFTVGEDPYVDKDTAEARAKTCVGCRRFNKPIKTKRGCPTCKPIESASQTAATVSRNLMRFVIRKGGHLSTQKDNSLHVCSLCQCELKAKVWVSDKILAKYTDDALAEKMPNYCWVKQAKQRAKEEQQ